MKYDIVTIGDSVEDVFVEPDLSTNASRYFQSGKAISFEFGEKIPLKAVHYEIGGSACNLAVGFSRLELKTSIATLLGDDTPRDKVLERLRDENVNLNNAIIDDEIQTGFSVIFSIDGERTIFVYHGVKDYSKLKIKKSISTDWFFLTAVGKITQEIETRVVAEVAENGVKFAWNPGSEQIAKGANHFKHLLACTSILFLNREEAIKFVNYPVRPQADEIMKVLHGYGPKIVVITNGKEGAKAYDGHQIYEAEADSHIARVDATGAGDSFAVGVLGKLIDADWKKEIAPEEIQAALRWGIKNSSSVIQYFGAQKGLLTKDEIDGYLQKETDVV